MNDAVGAAVPVRLRLGPPPTSAGSVRSGLRLAHLMAVLTNVSLLPPVWADMPRPVTLRGNRADPPPARPYSKLTVPAHGPSQRQSTLLPLQLCAPEDSGQQTDNLEWTMSSDVLIPTLRNRSYYNSNLAPGQVFGETTGVSVAVYIESMSSFKAQTMDFEVDMYLAMSWLDRRLAHNCTHPILIRNKGRASLLWNPDLYFVNSKFAYFQEVTTPNFMVLIYSDGTIFKSMRVDVTLSCMMDLERFPMDSQVCPIIIQSYAYVESVLNLSWHVDKPAGFPIGNNPNIKLNDMEIVDREWETCSFDYPMFRGMGRWSCIKAMIVMRRLIVFHMIQTYVPTGMLVIISWLSFYLDARAAPARISLTITTLLTLTTMSNGARQDLPQVAYVKALDIWLSLCTAFVFCVLLEYTFVSFYLTKRTTKCIHTRRTMEMHNACQQLGQPAADVGLATPSPSPPPVVARKREPSSPVIGRRRSDRLIQFEMIHGRAYSFVDYSPAAALVGNNGAASPSAAVSRSSRDEVRKPCLVCAQRWERFAKRIDRTSRVVFPASFGTLTVIYWIYYNLV